MKLIPCNKSLLFCIYSYVISTHAKCILLCIFKIYLHIFKIMWKFICHLIVVLLLWLNPSWYRRISIRVTTATTIRNTYGVFFKCQDCAKYFMYIVLFNPHGNSMSKGYYSHFICKEDEFSKVTWSHHRATEWQSLMLIWVCLTPEPGL